MSELTSDLLTHDDVAALSEATGRLATSIQDRTDFVAEDGRKILSTVAKLCASHADLESRLAAAEAALAACEDTKRLDWLERMAHDGDNIGDIDIGGSWVTQVVEVGDSAITGIRGEGATVREAIDRARAPLP